MTIDTDRLVQIGADLKDIEQRRARLLSELQGIARGGAPTASKGLRAPETLMASRPQLSLARPRRQPKVGLSTAIVELLKGTGAAHTAGDIVVGLNMPKTKSRVASVSTTLVRLAKEGRLKKDKQRGYRAV
jgi:hypothetical protein